MVILVGENRRDRQSRVRECHEYLDGAAGVIKGDSAEVGQTALGEVVMVLGGVRAAVGMGRISVPVKSRFGVIGTSLAALMSVKFSKST